MPPVCCRLPIGALARHVSPHVSNTSAPPAGGSIWATDVPGWITAAGTALLAIFAILTTIYAVRAFRKQSQEVSDQASMLQVQSEQLSEQRKINAEQTKVLGLQATELRESLESRELDRAERRRAQASRVFIWTETGYDPPATHDQATTGEPARFGLIAHVRNTSEQPIYALEIDRGPEKPEWMEDELLPILMPNKQEDRFQPWPEKIDITRGLDIPKLAPIARFRDAAGLHWHLTADGQLDEGPGERYVKPLRIRPSVSQ
jgi:cbb3-type cytochrome oxidase subunit 3